jgi:dethiobiotin synthetase
MSLFVTATDTGIGKTLITGGIAYALRARGLDVGCWKPVQSGDLLHDANGDVMRLKTVGDLPDAPERIGRFSYAEPLAPRLAAERAGAPLMLEDLLAAYRDIEQDHEHFLVEGAGGLAVPLTKDATVADFAQQFHFPLLIVARANLGTVNHTVLTVRYAESLGLRVGGVILSGGGREGADISEAHNAAYIEEYGGVPVIGRVPWLGEAPGVAEIREAVQHHVDLDRLEALLTD